MADTKISLLTEKVTPEPADLVVIVDSTAADNKKVQMANVGKATKLDDLAAPDDNTDLDASATKHGLCPKAPNDTAKVLRGGSPPAWGYDKVVQAVSTQTGEVATGTTTIPLDDTIPQNSEGDERMVRTITPKNSNNILKIDVVAVMSNNYAGAHGLMAALFQDSVAGALAVGIQYAANASCLMEVSFTHWMTAGTTSEITFKVRIGANQAGTTTFNGYGGNRVFGGVLASSIRVTELAA